MITRMAEGKFNWKRLGARAGAEKQAKDRGDFGPEIFIWDREGAEAGGGRGVGVGAPPSL